MLVRTFRFIATPLLTLAILSRAHAVEENNSAITKDLARILGELEDVETSMRDGSANKKNVDKENKKNNDRKNTNKKAGENADHSLTIVSEDEASRTARALAEKLKDIHQQSEALKAKIYSIQDSIASHSKEFANTKIEVVTETDDKELPMRILEVQATINQIPLGRHVNPTALEKDGRVPLFIGPLPFGEYEVHLQTVVGRLQHGWPFGVPQGKWFAEKKFAVQVKDNNPVDLKIVLKKVDNAPALEVIQAKDAKQ